jgi:hypothetical protein
MVHRNREATANCGSNVEASELFQCSQRYNAVKQSQLLIYSAIL